MFAMKSFKKKINSFAYSHIWLRYILDYLFPIIATAFSSLIFVFGMVVFLEPALLGGEASGIPAMVSGGSSGAAQVIKLIIFSFSKIDSSTLVLSKTGFSMKNDLVFLQNFSSVS